MASIVGWTSLISTHIFCYLLGYYHGKGEQAPFLECFGGFLVLFLLAEGFAWWMQAGDEENNSDEPW